MADSALTARLASAVGDVDAAEWDRLAGDGNPFTSHAFLELLEDSGSVGPGTGWQSAPLLLEDAGKLVGAMPSYLKGHSQGEYVFDHAWADAWHRAGGDYYPKLQVSVPFTPATGPRLLLADEAYAPILLRAAEQVVEQNGWSSAHATFVEPGQQAMFEDAGWLRRDDIQFHWRNRDYDSFDDFLSDLTSRKRKDLRKERRAASEGLEIRALSGDDIRPEHWDAFWLFYQDTGARKWGTPYLTREAFDLMGERMGDKLLLLLAFDEGQPIAGALNFIGAEALYGRYWGCLEDRRFLHFELCYYRAIDLAIELGLSRVEAGAQGGHKLARGYEPVATVSMHYLADPGFRAAVEDFLERERMGVGIDKLHLAERTPFRQR
ncbi:GNAT family N-acetyltransferase [Aurantiacibacter poecillastricola]|uniref:GNAT family N-acetyltransferase n=1 Tax=Aurantiacibacter poecillastricola TaxID=3064385 RepID=UPI00273E8289|nr:GNAT family N-acetyltransferase [Aurantiacibacter sp. 219JJ12-13]MDP5260291.1 GNAT family N-acetyltransferase [Aurantiacibacter sp. 219JJ12-13]